jgi:hypothetical protein
VSIKNIHNSVRSYYKRGNVHMNIKFRSVGVTIFAVEGNKYYIF